MASHGEHVFGFPFPPYPQQKDLMQAIHECIDQRLVGCLESPTGSGKTLSIICSAMSWMTAEQERILQEPKKAEKVAAKEPEVDWLQAFLVKAAASKEAAAKASSQSGPAPSSMATEASISSAKAQYKRMQLAIANANIAKSSSAAKTAYQQGHGAGDDFVLDHYDSDQPPSDEDSDDEESAYRETLQLPQLIYCSRTHTQLSQFVAEISKTKYAAHCQTVILASRKHMCINPSVNNLSNEMINDKCKDMNKGSRAAAGGAGGQQQQGKKAKSNCSGKCEYHSRHLEERLAMEFLRKIHDLEELVSVGKVHVTCPYYSTKQALPHANVVCMPYSILLHHDIRSAYDLKIHANTIIICDEAHNLVEAINGIYSAEVSTAGLQAAHRAVSGYLEAYRNRLSAKNIYYLTILMTVLKKIVDKQQPAGLVTVNDFLFLCGLDHINLFKLQRYIVNSQLQGRIGGYAEHMGLSVRSALRAACQFIYCLTNQDGDGRLFFISADGDLTIKFVMLNPGRYFEELTRQARCVLLLGGTLQPFNSLTNTLLAPVPRDKLKLFACGHIVPANQIKPVVIGCHPGPAGAPLEITHSNRLSLPTTNSLFTIILDLCNIVPGGVVVFFTSYQYMYAVLARWKADGRLASLHAIKPVFVEANSSHSMEGLPSTSDGLPVWDRYRMAVANGSRGAVLCSVMGGKLSEGINFSDNLARAVVIIGMPYPDPRDPVLQEKIKYYNSQQATASAPSSSTATSSITSSELYEALCMKVVNQSVGRAIRHIHDYASIVLVDGRYDTVKVHRLLPGWIRASMRPTATYTNTLQDITQFFAERRATNPS